MALSAATVTNREPIATFVIFKIETTGRPWEDGLKTKIIELCCIAVPRQVLEGHGDGLINYGCLNKFHHLIDPERHIQLEASQATNLSFYDIIDNESPKFEEIFQEFYTFLEEQPQPVCLVAHNGNSFDFKLLRNECFDIHRSLPEELLCVDSLRGFQKLLKDDPEKKKYNLPALCERFFEEKQAPERAEEKANMLLKCVVRMNDVFLPWADENAKYLNEIKPFV